MFLKNKQNHFMHLFNQTAPSYNLKRRNPAWAHYFIIIYFNVFEWALFLNLRLILILSFAISVMETQNDLTKGQEDAIKVSYLKQTLFQWYKNTIIITGSKTRRKTQCSNCSRYRNDPTKNNGRKNGETSQFLKNHNISIAWLIFRRVRCPKLPPG